MSEETVRLNPRTENLAGQKYGALTIISFAGYRHSAYWLCRCECGKEKAIAACNLKRGHQVSCGCGIQKRVDRPVEKEPEFKSYMSMLDRCQNPDSSNYADYGGRGITVCERWRQGFWLFIEDMGPRPSPGHTIDRIDNNGNYDLGNCRWATRKQQSRNRRSNRILELNGVQRTAAEWADVTGISRVTILSRLDQLGWSVEQALTVLPTTK